MPLPDIDPVIFQIGPFALRWYSLSYIAGIMLAWRYMVRMVETPSLWPEPPTLTAAHIDDFIIWATIGVIVGGRLGYVAFYNFDYYLANPQDILAVWQGGMSFHGGFLGTVLAGILFAWRRNISILQLGDMITVSTPIGLFLGRIANFINGELWGRVTDVPWGFIFPTGGPLARHPSQLYEAFLEGLVLLAILSFLVYRKSILSRPGTSMSLFFFGYGLSRFLIEYVREPDAHIGTLYMGLSLGQYLSMPMIIFGAFFIFFARRYQK